MFFLAMILELMPPNQSSINPALPPDVLLERKTKSVLVPLANDIDFVAELIVVSCRSLGLPERKKMCQY